MQSEQAFLALIRAGLWQTDPSIRPFIGLTAGQWEEVYAMSRRQTVSGICYDALTRLPDPLLPPDELLTRWVARVNAIEKTNMLMARSTARLVAFMQEAGLHPVVQKGLSVGRHYPSPSLREAGDIDLWFPEEELRKAVAAVRRLGKEVKSHPDRSYSFTHDGFVVEIHRKLINLGNPSAAASLRSLIACEKTHTAATHEGDLPVLSPLLEMLLIDVHIMRHSFGMGIGLRQICDYAISAARLHGLYSPDDFRRACHTFGISRWTAMLNDFVISYLDTPADVLPDSGYTGRHDDPAALIDIVREGGNFGHYLPTRRSILSPRMRSKLHTFVLIVRRSRFAARMAPREALWSFLRLILGQVH